jgi:hypothetical protein
MTDEERLHMITEQLIIVRDNLFRGLSKSMQKLQAQSINEVLELPNYTQSAKQEHGSTTCDNPVAWADHGVVNWIADKQFKHAALLYEHPQQRTWERPWVSLTDEEIDYYIVHRCGVATKKNLVELIRLCEIKLKEKNT